MPIPYILHYCYGIYRDLFTVPSPTQLCMSSSIHWFIQKPCLPSFLLRIPITALYIISSDLSNTWFIQPNMEQMSLDQPDPAVVNLMLAPMHPPPPPIMLCCKHPSICVPVHALHPIVYVCQSISVLGFFSFVILYFYAYFKIPITSFLVPGSLKLQVLSSTAIKVSWIPPPNADRLPLTYHVSYSSEFTSSTSKSTTEQSLDLTGLHPFDVYTVTVEAKNSGGRSKTISTSATTSVSGE